MDIRFRSIIHLEHEADMGHAIWHHPVADCDGVSATANTQGFTPLHSIDRHFGWNREVVDSAALTCNKIGEVCVVEFSPKLLLVPKTKGRGDAAFLIQDLLSACRASGVRVLHFTHFGFIQGRLPFAEVAAVISYIFYNVNTLGLDKIVFDIDKRVEGEFFKMLVPSQSNLLASSSRGG